MLTPDQEKMREAAKAAPDGEWTFGARYVAQLVNSAYKPLAECPNDTPGSLEWEAVAAHIATNNPAAILALLDQVEAQGWQPIETAPKDGTAVLVMRNIWPGTKSGRADECNGHNTYVAAWWADEGPQGSWVCYMDAVRDPRCPIEPTHWMPLPPPPEAA